MADIIDFKTRKVESPEPHFRLPPVGMAIACQCGANTYEIRSGGAVVCSRCQYQVNVEWKWLEVTDGK